MTYTMLTDPGHGWLAVPVTDLQELGLSTRDFSPFSYIKGEVVYLEEDCDFAVFWEAFIHKHGRKPEIREVHTDSDSIVRTYRRLS